MSAELSEILARRELWREPEDSLVEVGSMGTCTREARERVVVGVAVEDRRGRLLLLLLLLLLLERERVVGPDEEEASARFRLLVSIHYNRTPKIGTTSLPLDQQNRAKAIRRLPI